MTVLDEDAYDHIKLLCKRGDALMAKRQQSKALVQYSRALALVPEPKEEWEATTWILAAIGDAYFQLGRFSEARESLLHCMHCPDAIGNPFLHLRLGQAQYELGNMERAQDELARAMILDKSVFTKQDNKYSDYIKGYLLPEAVATPAVVAHRETQKEQLCDVMRELEIVGKDYTSGDFLRGCLRLKELWNRIPEPRTDTLNAYLVIEYGVAFALKLNDLDQAWEWALLAPAFREKRQDMGEVEFLVGKVAFERGDMQVAKENFLIAKKKSRGRIFIDEDPKYLKSIR